MGGHPRCHATEISLSPDSFIVRERVEVKGCCLNFGRRAEKQSPLTLPSSPAAPRERVQAKPTASPAPQNSLSPDSFIVGGEGWGEGVPFELRS